MCTSFLYLLYTFKQSNKIQKQLAKLKSLQTITTFDTKEFQLFTECRKNRHNMLEISTAKDMMCCGRKQLTSTNKGIFLSFFFFLNVNWTFSRNGLVSDQFNGFYFTSNPEVAKQNHCHYVVYSSEKA